MVGSVGGGGRLEFAVIGDPVNVAARVEACTRDAGVSVLLTEATRCLLEHTDIDLEEHDELLLKGKSEHVRIWGVPAPDRARMDGRSRSEVGRLTADT